MFAAEGPSKISIGSIAFLLLAAVQSPCATSGAGGRQPDSVRLARELWLSPDASMRVKQDPENLAEAEETAQFTDGGVEVTLDVWMPLRGLPETLRPQTAEAGAAPANALVLEPPHTFELDYRIHAPDGFVPDTLPDAEDMKLGPAVYSVKYQTEPDKTVKATVRFQVGKASYTKEDVVAFRETYLENGTAPAPVVRFVPAAQATAAAPGAGSRFEDIDGARKLTDLSPPEFDAACGWTNELARAKLPAQGAEIECEGQKIPFAWPNRCAVGGGRPKSGCAVTVAQTRQCMPAFLEQIKRDPCSFFVVTSMGEATDILAKVPECKGTAACVFSP